MKRGAPALIQGSERLGLNLSIDQVGRLERYERLLRQKAVPLGFVGALDAERLLDRHIIDSLRVVPLLRADDTEIIDIGSGAGLPGLVVGIARPSAHVTLIEARRRKAAFLELVAAELHLGNVSVVAQRAETLRSEGDVCLARAVANLKRSWALAERLLRPRGRLVYFAGAPIEPAPEVSGASAVEVVENPLVDSGGPLVIITRQ